MIKVNCLNPIAKVGINLLSDNYEMTDDFKNANAALVRSAAMHDLELPDSLLAVARAGAAVNTIPLDKCAEKGIVVFNTPGANANGVKELFICGMMLAARDVKGGMEWVKENIQINSRVFYVDINSGDDSYKDMQLMSKCKHNIIANSSFSWWGAWLNENKNKIVVAPKKWVNRDDVDSDKIELFCKNWTLL